MEKRRNKGGVEKVIKSNGRVFSTAPAQTLHLPPIGLTFDSLWIVLILDRRWIPLGFHLDWIDIGLSLDCNWTGLDQSSQPLYTSTFNGVDTDLMAGAGRDIVIGNRDTVAICLRDNMFHIY